ncbi:SPV051 hypothetical protein [Swinepox virus]|uniref:FEN1-like nuclease n=1 Tax=Swinepox virus (strain Swine/Nebraska/17077-99/1999) TaxID=300880 RepID=Q8V3P3_SWPV1|nr:Hypothetical protein SWPVgp051 [Swinepox virus]AAL69790.1 SPV051 hypothetical protein [Swinepox virus]UED36568.1 hypothetical protein SPVwb_050 [Swinepox virus]UED36717.1 hypothetical protein SPVdp_052 [Swinepox virus]UUA44241.1 SPV051 [Swinepox virus]
MGIKNLKTLLLETGSLYKITSIERNIINGIYVDTMSFFVSIAHSVNNVEDLYESFITYIYQWKKIGNVTLFIDRGVIHIKESLREKRRALSQNTMQRKRLEIEKLTINIDNLDIDDIMYDEIKTDMELRLRKLTFHNFLSSSSKLKTLLESFLETVIDDVNIIYCDGIDAEFVMCKNAKKLADQTGIWPLMISTDQDTLLFSSCDYKKKIIKTMNQMFIYIPCSKSRYLSKLVALTNGCDYFNGLYGLCITQKTLESIPLFDDFTIDNIVQSLAVRNYTKKSTDKYINVQEIIDFIDKYSSSDDSVYSNTLPEKCVTIQEFMFSALYKKWKTFDDTLLRGVSICSSLICILSPKKAISNDDIDILCKIINKNNKNKNDIINDIRNITNIFGYELYKNKNIYLAIQNLNTIMLCYRDTFYFNSENIIRNNIKNNIINISS